MSYRSALSNPSTTSGAVGTIVSYLIPSFTIATGNSYTFESINLPAGVWSINLSFQIQYDAGSIPQGGDGFVLYAQPEGAVSPSILGALGVYSFQTNALATDVTENYITSITCELGVPAAVFITFGANFTGVSLFNTPINNYSYQAIKLA